MILLIEICCNNRELDIIIYFIKNGANINKADINGETALFKVIQYPFFFKTAIILVKMVHM